MVAYLILMYLPNQPPRVGIYIILRDSGPALVRLIIFVGDFYKRDCGMLFSGLCVYFRASLKAVYADPWLVLTGEIQFVWRMDSPVPNSFLA